MEEHREADRDQEQQTTSELCVVCMSCHRSARFQCGHCIACHACARGLKICPFCRQRILAIIGVQEDDRDRTFSDPGYDDEKCYKCSTKAIWVFTCPDCANQRASSIIDNQPGWENLRHSRFVLCKKCLGKFMCPFCEHLSVKTDVKEISDDDSVS